MSLHFSHIDLRTGGSGSYAMTNGQFTMHGRLDYLLVQPPDRVEYTQCFVEDHNATTTAIPPSWPPPHILATLHRWWSSASARRQPSPMLHDDETPLAELERLRVENARLRAQIQHVAPSAAPRQPGQYPSPPVSADAGGVRTGQPRVSASRRWVGRALMGAMVVLALVTAALYASRVASSDFGHGVRDGWQEGK